MKTFILTIVTALVISGCSTSSRTTCNGKSYNAGPGELSIWCMWS